MVWWVNGFDGLVVCWLGGLLGWWVDGLVVCWVGGLMG